MSAVAKMNSGIGPPPTRSYCHLATSGQALNRSCTKPGARKPIGLWHFRRPIFVCSPEAPNCPQPVPLDGGRNVPPEHYHQAKLSNEIGGSHGFPGRMV